VKYEELAVIKKPKNFCSNNGLERVGAEHTREGTYLFYFETWQRRLLLTPVPFEADFPSGIITLLFLKVITIRLGIVEISLNNLWYLIDI
jgi:hypothetical protein